MLIGKRDLVTLTADDKRIQQAALTPDLLERFVA